MKCRKCSADLTSGAQFCHRCGAAVDLIADPVAAPLSPPAAGETPASPPRMRSRSIPDTPEETLWEGTYSPKASISGCLIALLETVTLGIAAAVLAGMKFQYWSFVLYVIPFIWAYVGLRLLFYRLSVRYRLTNQRLFHERGILRRITNRIEVIDIDDVAFEQGLLDRMVNVGRIKITSTDRSDPELWLEGIDNVQQVFGQIDKARRTERLRRGLHIETV